MIVKRGSTNDKANLPEETRFNRSHTGRKRRVPEKQSQNPARRTPQQPVVGRVAAGDGNQHEPAVGAN